LSTNYEFVDNSNIIDITVVENQVIISDTGLQGPRGTGLLSGSGAPENTLGINGDFYLDTAFEDGRPKYHLYGPKVNDEWPDTYVDLFTLPESVYVHTQNTPASSWVIDHNLGFFPNITVVDSSFPVPNQAEGNIVYNNLNRVTIDFSAAFAGKAYLS
jgi:hypothetical protein